MSDKKFILIVLATALVLRLALLAYNLNFNSTFSIQQDNYATFTDVWRNGTMTTGGLSHFDTRLFPGYPLLILILSTLLPISTIASGVFISMVSSVAAIYFFWLWTKSRFATLLVAFFPPVWLQLATKVATEPLSVCLMLASILLAKKDKYWQAGLILGFTGTVRNIAIFLALALVIELFQSKIDLKIKMRHLFGFTAAGLVSMIALLMFNYHYWGAQNLLYQFSVYNSELDTSLGIVMLFQNIYRTIDWGQYRTLVSGLTYVTLNMAGLFWLFKNRSQSPVVKLSWYWAGMSMLFLMALSMPTFLEDFSRYAIAFWPTIALGLSLLAKDLKKRYLDSHE